MQKILITSLVWYGTHKITPSSIWHGHKQSNIILATILYGNKKYNNNTYHIIMVWKTNQNKPPPYWVILDTHHEWSLVIVACIIVGTSQWLTQVQSRFHQARNLLHRRILRWFLPRMAFSYRGNLQVQVIQLFQLPIMTLNIELMKPPHGSSIKRRFQGKLLNIQVSNI